MNDDTTVPAVAVVSTPPAPEREPELSIDEARERLYVTVAMPRVRAVALRDYSGRAGDWRNGAVLELDQQVFDQANDDTPLGVPKLELIERLEATVERKMPRLRGQQGDTTTYEAYQELRAQLGAQAWAGGRYASAPMSDW